MRQEGLQQGMLQKQQEMVKSFYEQNLPIESIEKSSGLIKEKIMEIVKK